MSSRHRAAPLTVHPDIRRARTIASRVYSDPAIYAAQEELFARSWLYLADAERLRAPGSALPLELTAAGLAEPLVLTRDLADELHLLSNVCTHRGTLVCEGETSGCKQLRCRYHGRRFKLDGSLAHMPEFDGVEGFPAKSDDLPRVPLGNWRDTLLFASLDPETTFGDLISPLRPRLDELPWAEARFDATGSRDYLVRANWALYVENYLEGFHIPYVHASLAGALDYGAYEVELYDRAVLQLGIAGDGEPAFDLPAEHPDAGRQVAAFYYWLWPSTMLNVYPWGLSLNVVTPLAVDRTRVSFRWYVWDPARRDEGAGADLDRVEREDEAVVETVQRGVSSRLYDRGRYSARREQGVHHFHRLLADALQD